MVVFVEKLEAMAGVIKSCKKSAEKARSVIPPINGSVGY
jgi:hypothetical protein